MGFFEKFDDRKRGSTSELEGIVRNLEHILNTKRGYGSILPGFGIRSMNEYVSRTAIALAVMDDVRDGIKKYEPRLLLEEISLVPSKNPFRMSFVVKCSVKETSQTLSVSFDTVFGSFDVSE